MEIVCVRVCVYAQLMHSIKTLMGWMHGMVWSGTEQDTLKPASGTCIHPHLINTLRADTINYNQQLFPNFDGLSGGRGRFVSIQMYQTNKPIKCHKGRLLSRKMAFNNHNIKIENVKMGKNNNKFHPISNLPYVTFL
jgi:hypothetical protein